MRFTNPLASALLFALIALFLPTRAYALPTEGEVVGGAASIRQPTATSIHVEQVTERAILSWRGFDIAVDELVQFNQPTSASVALNRIWGGEPTMILGQLRANGRVFLMNPNGILFGAGSVINVAGLGATTLPIRDSDFLAGQYRFAQDPAHALAAVINRGHIQVSDQGFVFLAAPGVLNEGVIVANLGSVLLGSTTAVTLDLMGTGLISYALDGKVLSQVTGPDGQSLADAVRNDGTIQADGGKVILAARAAGDIFSSVVNQSGLIQARSLIDRGGVIELTGSDPVQNTGELGWQANLGKVQNADGWVKNTGTLDVSAAEAGAAQGAVTLSGHFVGSSGEIVARGAEGATGGRVLVTSSEKTVLTNSSGIDTSGVENANAGNVVVWSDRTTLADGVIVARGGDSSGDGGQVEVSGLEALNMVATVDGTAPNGVRGTLLLDPKNITVANGGTATLPEVDSFTDTPALDLTIAPATINASTANVVLQANNDITIDGALNVATTGVDLTMQAGHSIVVNQEINTSNGDISFTSSDPSAVPGFQDPGPRIVLDANISSSGGGINFNGPVEFGFPPITIDSGNAPTGVIFGSTVAVDAVLPTIIAREIDFHGNVSRGRIGGGLALRPATPDQQTIIGGVAGTPSLDLDVNEIARLQSLVGLIIGRPDSTSTITVTGSSAFPGSLTLEAGTGTVLFSNGSTLEMGQLNVIADEIELLGTAIRGSGFVTLQPQTLDRSIEIAGLGGTASLDLTAAELNTLQSGSVVIGRSDGSGGIRFNSIKMNGTIQTGSGTITIPTDQTVETDGFLVLKADEIDLNGTARITGIGSLSLQQGQQGTHIEIGGAGSTSALDLTVAELAALDNGLASIGIGQFIATGGITVRPVTFSDPVTLRSPFGTISVLGQITGVDNAAITIDGPSTLAANIVTTGNAIRLNGPVNLSLPTTLNAGVGDVVFGSTIDGPSQLTVLTTGNTTFSGAVGGSVPLSSLSTNPGGMTRIFGGLVRTAASSGQFYSDAVSFVNNTTLDAGAGDILFGTGSSINGGVTLALNSTGLTGIEGPVGNTAPLTTLTTNLGGTTRLNGGSLTTTGAQTYNDAVTLDANTTLNAGGGNIAFGTTLNGTFTLTTNSTGATTFGGAVGGTTPLASLNTNAGGTTQISGGSITTTGGQTYNDPVTLGMPTTLTTTNSPVTFGTGVNGAQSLAIAAGTGTVTFGGASGGVTPLASLTATGGSFPLSSIKSTGPVTLTATTGSIFDNLNFENPDPVANITATTATLNAATSIGRLVGEDVDLLFTDVATLHASTTAGLIAVGNLNAISLGTITARGGPAAIANLPGDMTITGTVTSTTHGVILATGDGSILGAAGTSPHLVAAGDSALLASGGVLGTQAPIRVNITRGNLDTGATGQVNGISGALTGTVLPSNSITVLVPTPGAILFNGIPFTVSGIGGTGGSAAFIIPGASVGAAYLNPNAIVPGYYGSSSGAPSMTSFVASYVNNGSVTASSAEIEGESESAAGTPSGGEGKESSAPATRQ